MAKNACFKGKNRHTNAENAPFKATHGLCFWLNLELKFMNLRQKMLILI